MVTLVQTAQAQTLAKQINDITDTLASLHAALVSNAMITGITYVTPVFISYTKVVPTMTISTADSANIINGAIAILTEVQDGLTAQLTAI